MWTNLIGDESLEAEDIGWGLEGAENIGQEGERGEVGLGDVALMGTYTQNVQFYSIGSVIQVLEKQTFTYEYSFGHYRLWPVWHSHAEDIFRTWSVCCYDSSGSAWKHKMEEKTKQDEITRLIQWAIRLKYGAGDSGGR